MKIYLCNLINKLKLNWRKFWKYHSQEEIFCRKYNKKYRSGQRVKTLTFTASLGTIIKSHEKYYEVLLDSPPYWWLGMGNMYFAENEIEVIKKKDYKII